MLSAKQIAKYFLAHFWDHEEGELISNLKLQKLLYYAQGFCLALHEVPLFEDRIEAWTHGPVVPVVYREYSRFGSSAIPEPEDFDPSLYNEGVRNLLDDVYSMYGQFSAWKLARLTHEEPPWRDAYELGPSTVITPNALKDYFKTLIEV
jgi:uncharacterized phage-associated protein